MIPAQGPQLLGPRAGQQRDHDVVMQPVRRCLGQHAVDLLGGE